MNKLKFVFNSDIIKNDFKKQNIINNWIKEKMDKDNLKYELLYKMSENGSSSKDFHKFCDNKGPTLTLIKTTGNAIFGGFTPLNWHQEYKSEYDNKKKTFVFSLNLMEKFELKTSTRDAIFCGDYYGPTFGNCDTAAIYFSNSLKEGRSSAKEKSNFLPFKKLKLTKGEGLWDNFDTTEIEVFRVL